MGNGVMLVIVGVAVAINILIIKIKLESKRIADAMLDGTVLVLLSIVFGSSFNGLVTATVASSIVSLYLWKNPPKLTNMWSEEPSPPGKEKATWKNSEVATDLKSSWNEIMADLKQNKP